MRDPPSLVGVSNHRTLEFAVFIKKMRGLDPLRCRSRRSDDDDSAHRTGGVYPDMVCRKNRAAALS